MKITLDELYEAQATRDPAYDGRFYVAVTTTGVYCRPTCPGRPKRENMRFYETAAEAREAGFRACKRCKPEA
jgi:methylphosphotriester-DNA--protein-cysteine methyltransferase